MTPAIPQSAAAADHCHLVPGLGGTDPGATASASSGSGPNALAPAVPRRNPSSIKSHAPKRMSGALPNIIMLRRHHSAPCPYARGRTTGGSGTRAVNGKKPVITIETVPTTGSKFTVKISLRLPTRHVHRNTVTLIVASWTQTSPIATRSQAPVLPRSCRRVAPPSPCYASKRAGQAREFWLLDDPFRGSERPAYLSVDLAQRCAAT